FLPAMVLTDVNHEMLLMKDETFGPVVGVMKFSDYKEAVRLANDSYLGLTASVWSKSNSRAENIAKRIKAGAITINDHLMSHGLAETPWGGFKQSGIGRTHGKLGFDEMTQPMVIVKDILPFVKKNLWWHPFSKKLFFGLKGLLDFLYNKSIGKKANGILKLLKIVPRIFIKD
ncbi:MAG: aldehyde dehydrogenase family protein, partial [Ignavibacteria bacterium]|nr:aldehyde dehydrogenase family protein [Ignavibacteria bacterium]